MAARRAQAGSTQSYASVVVGAAVLAAGAATFFGVPGAPVVWVGLVVAGWLEQSPMFTGKKDFRGYPTPAHPGEQKAMNTYRFWADVRWRLMCPTGDWLPGWPVLGSWLAAVVAAALVSFAPVRAGLPPWLVWLNVGCAFVTVVQVMGSRRRTVAENDLCPGVRVDSLPALIAERSNAIALLAATVAVAGVVVYVGWKFTPVSVAGSGPLGSLTLLAWPLLTGLAAAGGVVAHPWESAALGVWRELVQVRREWAPRWQMLKQDPAPFLIEHRSVGPATVDTFDAPASAGAAFFYVLSAKITQTLGANMRVAVLETPNVDGQGQPASGTCHPLRFQMVMWPADQMPNLTEPGVGLPVAELLVRSAMAWACDGPGYARFVLTGCDLITEPESPAVWATTWVSSLAVPISAVRTALNGDLAAGAGTGVLTDHRAAGGGGVVFFGAVFDPEVEYLESSGVTAESMGFVAEEDEWRVRWAAVLKQNVNAPIPQFTVKTQADLADGTTVHYQPFVTLLGEDPAQFMVGLEGKLAATISGSAPFMAISWYSQRGGDRQGERHAQAFAVSWAEAPVPSLTELAPVRNDAPRWVIAGHMNEAFSAARLARPEVLTAQCLTTGASRGHIWQVSLRLYGGVTLADVRGAAARLRGALGTEWLRVAPSSEGCTIFAGGLPAKVKLAQPERDTQRLVALDWEQAWLDSKVSGVGGLLPTLHQVDHLPHNESVQVLDFNLPAGVSVEDVKAATGKLKTATANAFIEVREGVNGAASLRLLVSETSPMPEYAPFDFEAIDESSAIPFATGVEGEPVVYDYLRDAHLLVVGGTGTGKSATLQALLYPALVHGCDVYLADPTKGGADFQFAMPWVKAFAVDVFDAAAMMNAVYAEVLRRKELNARHGVGSYLELPEELRPPHSVVVLDEFTSLMMTDTLARPDLEDEEAVAEYEALQLLNSAKNSIGTKAGRIAREARSAGFTLLLATQRLTAKTLETIPGAQDLRSNMSRLILGKATFGELQSALKDPTSAPPIGDVVPRGRGLLEVSGERIQYVQSWYVQDIQHVLAAHLKERRAPLTDEERLDLGPFMPRGVGGGHGRGPSRAVSAGPVVVELDDMEISLDDLAGFGDDDPTAAGELPTWAAEFAATRVSNEAEDVMVDGGDTVVFLDVDGVLAPVDGVLAGWGDFQVVDADGRGHVKVSAEMLARLGGLPASVVWLTGWEDDAETAFGPMLGRRCTVLHGSGESEFGWWKIDAAVAWLDEHPEVAAVVWVDDELDARDELDVPHRDVVADLLSTRGLGHLLLSPAGSSLSRDELEEVGLFVGEVAGDEVGLELTDLPGLPVPEPEVSPAGGDGTWVGPVTTGGEVEGTIPVTPTSEAASVSSRSTLLAPVADEW